MTRVLRHFEYGGCAAAKRRMSNVEADEPPPDLKMKHQRGGESGIERSMRHGFLRRALAATLLLLMSIVSAMATEEPSYQLIEKSGEFELRQYAPMIVAEAYVEGSLDEASSAGFRLIADYIFGNNRIQAGGSGEKIAMTAPVIAESASQKIEMTAPVTAERTAGRWRIHFVMPSRYTMATLPAPNNPRVALREVPGHKSAAIVFSGLAREDNLKAKTEALLAWMTRRGLDPASTPQLARYNPPWTLPFLRRNEILVPCR